MNPQNWNIQNIVDAQGFQIALTGMIIVFTSLVIVSLSITILPKMLKIVAKYFPETEESIPVAAPKKVKQAMRNEHDEEAEVAAIAYALFHRKNNSLS